MSVFQYNQIWELSGKVCVHFLVLIIMFVTLRAQWGMQEKNALSNCNCKEKGGVKCAVTWQNHSWAFHTRPWAPILHPHPWCQEDFFCLFLLGCDVLTQPISLNSDTVCTGVTSLPGILLRTSPSQAVHLYATPDRILISRNCTAFHFLSLFLPSLELKIGSTGRLKQTLLKTLMSIYYLHMEGYHMVCM